MPSNHFILCCSPLLLPSTFPSIRVWATGEGPSGPGRRGWQTTSVFLPWEPHEQYEKTKRHGLLTKIKCSMGASQVAVSKNPPAKHKRCRFDLWVEKIALSRKWQPSPVFLPENFHGQRSPAAYSPWGHRVGHDRLTAHTNSNILFCPNLYIPSFQWVGSIFFNFLATPHGIWHLISPTRNRICTPWTGSSAS